MAIFNSYVKLPEGNLGCFCMFSPLSAQQRLPGMLMLWGHFRWRHAVAGDFGHLFNAYPICSWCVWVCLRIGYPATPNFDGQSPFSSIFTPGVITFSDTPCNMIHEMSKSSCISQERPLVIDRQVTVVGVPVEGSPKICRCSVGRIFLELSHVKPSTVDRFSAPTW